MLPQNILSLKVFSDLIAQANSLLRMTDRQIWERYHQYPICFADFYENGERQKTVEIRFDNQQISIECLLNDSGFCDYAFITPDNVKSLPEYVNFFNAMYEYDAIRRRWILADGFLTQKKTKLGICFMVNC